MNQEMDQRIPIERRRQARRETVVAALGLAVAVAALSGVVIWRDTASRPVRLTAPVSAAAAAGTDQRTRPFTYYLVSSPDQTGWVESALSGELPSFTSANRGAQDHIVVPVTDPGAAARLQAAIHDDDLFGPPHSAGAPQILDLRPYLAAAEAAPTVALPDSDTRTGFYIVSSPEQAQFVRLQLDREATAGSEMSLFWTEKGPLGLQADDIFGEDNNQPGRIRFEISVAASSEDADRALDAAGQIDAQVFDLRAH